MTQAGSQQQTCHATLRLDPLNPPALSQNPPFNSKTVLSMGIPVPVYDSTGTGSGNPSIDENNGTCAYGGISVNPGHYTVSVSLYPGAKLTQPVTGGVNQVNQSIFKSYKSVLTGTIYVVVG